MVFLKVIYYIHTFRPHIGVLTVFLLIYVNRYIVFFLWNEISSLTYSLFRSINLHFYEEILRS